MLISKSLVCKLKPDACFYDLTYDMAFASYSGRLRQPGLLWPAKEVNLYKGNVYRAIEASIKEHFNEDYA